MALKKSKLSTPIIGHRTAVEKESTVVDGESLQISSGVSAVRNRGSGHLHLHRGTTGVCALRSKWPRASPPHDVVEHTPAASCFALIASWRTWRLKKEGMRWTLQCGRISRWKRTKWFYEPIREDRIIIVIILQCVSTLEE